MYSNDLINSSDNMTNMISKYFTGSYLIAEIIMLIFYLIIMWIIFEKANKPGWAAIIPIYNVIVMLDIAGLDWWHIFIMIFVPFAAVIYAVLIPYRTSKRFGKSTIFSILSIFFSIITYAIIAFGNAKYEED